METSILFTDLAQQFSLSVGGPSHPVVVPLRVARLGRRGFFDPRSFLPKADMPDMVSVSVSRAKSTLYERSAVFCGEPTFCMASHCLNAISTAR
ncbi:MAG: hypothetical protein WA592_25295, partial [Pseudolabrys sp.]